MNNCAVYTTTAITTTLTNTNITITTVVTTNHFNCLLLFIYPSTEKHEQKGETKTRTHKQKTKKRNLYHLYDNISDNRLKYLYVIKAKESKK